MFPSRKKLSINTALSANGLDTLLNWLTKNLRPSALWINSSTCRTSSAIGTTG